MRLDWQIGALTREIDEENDKMKTLPAYKRILDARSDFNAMMAAVNEVLQSVMFPDAETAACGGDCSRCQGCGGH